MTLEEKLTKVDEYIWKKFEKVTNYCYEKFGYDKWDLSAGCRDIGTAGFILCGVGLAVTGMGYNPPSNWLGILVGGIAYPALGISIHYLDKREDELLQRMENYLYSRTGTALAPSFGSFRPKMLILESAFLSMLVYPVDLPPVPKEFPFNPEVYHNLWEFFLYSWGTAIVGYNSMIYFRSQLPKPPKAEKGIVKALSKKLAGVFHPKGDPAIQKATYHHTPYTE